MKRRVEKDHLVDLELLQTFFDFAHFYVVIDSDNEIIAITKNLQDAERIKADGK